MPSVTVIRGGGMVLSVDVPTSDRYSTYDCVLIGPSGAEVWRLPVTVEQARDTLAIRVPSAGLTAGEYRLIVQGKAASSSADLASYRFRLTRSE